MSIIAGELSPGPNLGLGDEMQLPDFGTEEYGFAFIKSGFEQVHYDLAADFKDYGISVVGACPIIMKPAVVDYIYRDSRKEPFYPAMSNYLITRPVVAMALHGEDQNTQATLNDLKLGTNGRPCLREKYAQESEPVPEDEIEAWCKGIHPHQDEVTVRLTQRNVFHAADTSDEAVESLRLLSIYNAEFWTATSQGDLRLRKLARYLTINQTGLILI
jgi:nucleoside diphosphate kinase